jgi:uncharacterized protein (TIRG00374 family)
VRRVIGIVVAGLAFYVVFPAFVQVVSAWPRLVHLRVMWLFIMLVTEAASFVCAIWLLRLVLRTRLWFSVAAALLAGNAATNVLPAGVVAGVGIQYQMLAASGVEADRAAGGLAASSIIGLASLFMLPIFALPVIFAGAPVSSGLVHTAFLGIGLFVLIVVVGAVLLTTDQVLATTADFMQWLSNSIPRRTHRTTNLRARLLEQRDLVRAELGRQWWQAVLLMSGRIGLDFCALLAALRATGARPSPSLVLLAFAASDVIALVPFTPGGLGVVEASLSGLLVLAGVPSAAAVVATLAYRLATYWFPTFAGGALYLAFRHRYGPPRSGAGLRRSP